LFKNLAISEIIPTLENTDFDILLHQMLTRVKVEVDCSYNDWFITAIANMITVGDICRYLSNGVYRLPMYGEFGTLGDAWDGSNPVAGGWVKGGGDFTSTPDVGDAKGTVNFIKTKNLGSAINTTMGVTLPASGYRNFSSGDVYSGMLYAVGNSGRYWSSSVFSGDAAMGCHLGFSSNTVNAGSFNPRSHGFSVRCVKN
jgi:uncharacterized protein (TIGR02145 family)